MNEAERAIAALRGRFLERLPSDKAALAQAMRDPGRAGLQHLAHRLAGSAGVFGFPDLSRAAGAVDVALSGHRAAADLAAGLAALTAEIDAALADGDRGK